MTCESKVELCRKITKLWFVYAGGETQKVKVQLELRLASDLSDNKKGFLKCVNNNRASNENIGPILAEDS